MKTKLCVLAAACAAGLLLQGCAAVVVGGAVAAAGYGAYTYVSGELKATESQPIDVVWKAAEAAAKDMQLPVVKQAKDGLSGNLELKGVGDKHISVNLRSLGEKSTELRIRVGTFGDESFSRQLYEKIKSHY